MVDITQPSIMGFTLTPWLIVLFLCIIGTIVFLILVVSGFSKRDSKEREMIEKAALNTTSIPVTKLQSFTSDSDADSQGATESLFGDETEIIAPLETEVMIPETEVMEDSATEVLETDATEVMTSR